MSMFVYEFLYRGQPAGSDQAPGFHVVLGEAGTDAFRRPTLAVSDAMTPEQAAALGFDLPTVLNAINTAMGARNTALTTQIDALNARIATLSQQVQTTAADKATASDPGSATMPPAPTSAPAAT